MSVHVGIHWNMVTGIIKIRSNNEQRLYGRVTRLVVLMVSVYGLYAFLSRGMIQRMFLLREYVFFDYQESLIFLMADYIAMMCFFASIAYGSRKFIQKRNKTI